MRIGVISDTHGDRDALHHVVKLVTNVDIWLHAGDCSEDAEYLESLVKVPVIAARGNCDHKTTARLDEFINVADKKILLTHGHRYSVKQDTYHVAQVGKLHDVDIVVYGHTHVPDNSWYQGMLLFNPGSGYGGHGSCGIIEIDIKGQIVGTFVKLHP